MNRRDFFRLSARAAAAGLILPTWGRSMVAVPGLWGPLYCKRYDYIIYDDLVACEANILSSLDVQALAYGFNGSLKDFNGSLVIE